MHDFNDLEEVERVLETLGKIGVRCKGVEGAGGCSYLARQPNLRKIRVLRRRLFACHSRNASRHWNANLKQAKATIRGKAPAANSNRMIRLPLLTMAPNRHA